MKFRIIETEDISNQSGNYAILLRNNKKFWIGSVNVYDGYIEEVWTVEQAKKADFHHNLYWSVDQIQKLWDEEIMPFWINKTGLQIEWTQGKIPSYIVKELKRQIKILV